VTKGPPRFTVLRQSIFVLVLSRRTAVLATSPYVLKHVPASEMSMPLQSIKFISAQFINIHIINLPNIDLSMTRSDCRIQEGEARKRLFPFSLYSFVVLNSEVECHFYKCLTQFNGFSGLLQWMQGKGDI